MSKDLRFNNKDFLLNEIEYAQSYMNKKTHKHIQDDAKDRYELIDLRRTTKRSLGLQSDIYENE
jgi:hypothetical protein